MSERKACVRNKGMCPNLGHVSYIKVISREEDFIIGSTQRQNSRVYVWFKSMNIVMLVPIHDPVGFWNEENISSGRDSAS